ncbi:YchJ family protein [Nocardia sp. NPDC058176]|uniref:YchJ family protein n=1 Tax=Nocardia sp. NPDC058176 TaxID=3346368 RepID=UPI0036DCB937
MGDVKLCPCRRGESFEECCGPILAGERAAATAERLMRSRYTAYVVGDTEYLLRSWHPETRPADLVLDSAQRWLFLEIVATERGGLFDDSGTVEFIAHYKLDGVRDAMHEVSTFARVDGAWVYVDGTFRA